MGKKYVVTGATLKCAMGTKTSDLTVTSHKVQINGKDRGNISDAVPLKNVAPFGNCLVVPSMPRPCMPACSIWIAGKSDVLVGKLPALLDSDITVCPAGGGIITITDCGQ